MIQVRGAREHNLRSVDLDLPTGGLVAFIGPSGSGKSSLAFATLHGEARRRYLTALAAHDTRLGRLLSRPQVDSIDGLPATVALDQRAATLPSDATVARILDTLSLWRLVFGRGATPVCPSCGTAFRVVAIDEIVASLHGVAEGTRVTVEAGVRAGAAAREAIATAGFSRVRVDGEVFRIEEAPKAGASWRIVVDRLRMGPDRAGRLAEAVRLAARVGDGIVTVTVDEVASSSVVRSCCPSCATAVAPIAPRLFRPDEAERCALCAGVGVTQEVPCATCRGTGLGAAALAARWGDLGFADALGLDAESARRRLVTVTDPLIAGAAAALVERLDRLRLLGLGHLAQDRRVGTLSDGELGRVRLAGLVGARLSGVLYVLDEPAAGLSDAELPAVLALVRELVADGNTVLVVEHRRPLVDAADWVIEFGPGAGAEGGRVVFVGPPSALATADTATGRWWGGQARWPAARASESLLVPKGGRVLAVVGPSGSGKSAFLRQVEAAPAPFERVLRVEGSASRVARSLVATYVGFWTPMRELFASTPEARARGLAASFFSLGSPGGRCEACAGTGERRVEVELLAEVWVRCGVCEGRRYAADVLTVAWAGRSPTDVLEMRASDALVALASIPKLALPLRALRDVGLGHLPLGRTARTLSGGEANRLRLARALARGEVDGRTVVLVDEPTRGLHPDDAVALLRLLWTLADRGAAVVVATSDADFAGACDDRLSVAG